LTSTRENLLFRLFKDYYKFFYIENQIALIEGRNYEIIYIFYDTLSTIRSKDTTSSQWMEKLNKLTQIVDDFVSCSFAMYPFLQKSDETFNPNKNIIIKSFNDNVSDIFDQFYITYSRVSTYKQSMIVEELLIEFNNFLSHFTRYILDQDLSSGVTHLYRGCLDGYKDIVLENTTMLLSDIDMRDKFIDLRVQECDNIGLKEENKLFILEIYKQITEDILSLYQCHE